MPGKGFLIRGALKPDMGIRGLPVGTSRGPTTTHGRIAPPKSPHPNRVPPSISLRRTPGAR